MAVAGLLVGVTTVATGAVVVIGSKVMQQPSPNAVAGANFGGPQSGSRTPVVVVPSRGGETAPSGAPSPTAIPTVTPTPSVMPHPSAQPNPNPTSDQRVVAINVDQPGPAQGVPSTPAPSTPAPSPSAPTPSAPSAPPAPTPTEPPPSTSPQPGGTVSLALSGTLTPALDDPDADNDHDGGRTEHHASIVKKSASHGKTEHKNGHKSHGKGDHHTSHHSSGKSSKRH